MWLTLDLNGILLNLKITGFTNCKHTSTGDNWCEFELSLNADNLIDYYNQGCLALPDELESLISAINALIKGKIQLSKRIEFIEPDLSFVLVPSDETYDIRLEMRVMFWNGRPSDNYLSVSFYRDNIKAFLTYLELVSKRLKTDDKTVQKYISENVFRKYQ